MIRSPAADLVSRSRRRQLLRAGFLTFAGLVTAEIAATFAPFMRVTRVTGLGVAVATAARSEILGRFAATDDEPILFSQYKFFLIHPPGGIAAAYRKCTHLGCAVPFNKTEDQFHCVCHQSIYEKRTAVLKSGPAPWGLDLFHVSEQGGRVVVDTNPLNVMVRSDNRWHDEHLEVRG